MDQQKFHPMKTNAYEVCIHEKLDAFRLQKMLRSSGIFIPSDEVISLYFRAKKYYLNGISGDSPFSITELSSFLEKSAGDGTDFMLRLVKILVLDVDLRIKSLFFWAGVLLIINSFGTERIPLDIRRYLSLSVSVFYYINSGRYILTYFYHEWIAQAHSEECTIRFREALCKRALSTGDCKPVQTNGISTDDFKVWQKPTMSQLLTFIKEQIYEPNPSNILTRRDFEMLLLEELGNSYTPRVLKDIIPIIDKNRSGSISCAELHYFLVSETSSAHCLQRAWMVFWGTIAEPDWIHTCCFFSGSVLQFFSTLSKVLETNLSFLFGIVNPDLVVMVLFVIGCNGFLRSEYEIRRDEFNDQARAKDILVTHIRYGSQYSDTSGTIRKNMSSDDNSMNQIALTRLLDESNLHLSERKLEKLFHDIDMSVDGVISSEEIEMFAPNEGKSKQVAIIYKLLKSISFWSNFTWLIGSYAYIVSIYPPVEITGLNCYIIGSFSYWLGGVCLCGSIGECTAARLRNMVKLNNALATIIENESNAMDRSETTSTSSNSFEMDELEQSPV